MLLPAAGEARIVGHYMASFSGFACVGTGL